MNELETKGRNQTLRVFASVVLFSLYTIITYNIVNHVETGKIVQQIIRFILTLLLIYLVFKGKQWAVVVLTLLFTVSVLIGLVALLSDVSIVGKIPVVVMIIIYAVSIYHLNFSTSFKAYFNYLTGKQ